jgi:CTP:molybdopterin cytidylyltransferase MocA
MGGPKALLQLDGRTYLERLLIAFRDAGIESRFVVGRDPTLQSICAEHRATLLVNPEPERGMLSSLQVCLAAVGAATPTPDALFVAPVDCPRVAAATVRQLAAAFEVSGAPIVLPLHAGRRGHPVLFSAAVFDELRRAPLAVGARAVVRAHAQDLLAVPVDDPAVLDDFDTPADAARLDPDCAS